MITLPAPAVEVRKEGQRILGFTGTAVDGYYGPKTHQRFNLLPGGSTEMGQLERLLGMKPEDATAVLYRRFQELDDFPDASLWPPSAEVFTQVENPPAPTTGAPDTRPSSAMHAPLGSQERAVTFGGPFQYRRTGHGEDIEILGDWEEKNIVRIEVPQLRKVPGNFSKMAVNRRVAAQTLALWAAWEKAGLLGLVLSYEGAFVPRMIRGSTTSLSNHAYGSAFDVNYEWNQLGATPAALGKRGCVRELVPIAHAHGWFWGGNFTRLDGMHFEVCKVLG